VQGASALQEILSKSNLPLSVFVVWEPVLAMDIRSPTSRTLARIWDGRAKQFWDKDRLIAIELNKAADSSGSDAVPERHVPRRGGLVWDAVAIFSAGKKWAGTMPHPDYLGGAVAAVTDDVRARLAEPDLKTR